MKWHGTAMRWCSALVMVCALESAQAARPVVVDELPGLPGQPASYWHAVRGEQEAAQTVRMAARNEAANVFFTGKPYDADLEGYLFRFRTYRPDVARWTSADPSGFPDGANGDAYACNPLSEFDWQGLAVVTGTTEGVSCGNYIGFNVTDPPHQIGANGGLMRVEWTTGSSAQEGLIVQKVMMTRQVGNEPPMHFNYFEVWRIGVSDLVDTFKFAGWPSANGSMDIRGEAKYFSTFGMDMQSSPWTRDPNHPSGNLLHFNFEDSLPAWWSNGGGSVSHYLNVQWTAE